MRSGTRGSASAAVPIAISDAPAARYSRASAAVRIPPTPITGIATWSRTRRVANTPIGNRAGPLTPPEPLPRARAELEAARAGVGTGRVDLKRRDHRQVGERGDHPCVVVERSARDVDEHAGAPQLPPHPPHLVRPHRLETRVGQSHGVEHAPREFGAARRGMASPSLRRHGLGDDAAQGVEVDHTAHLAAEAGGAGGEENGVLKRDAEQLDRRHRPPAGATTASLRSNSSRYATIPSAIALASLCWPRLEARNAPSVRFVAKPVSTRMAGRRAVVSTMNPACCTP